ncbi:enoyl-ACP reductase FabI [Streptomyces sp. NRRL F-5135]|uniref:enoyl-ACP reductase FabI n=1 Tax=Streptomyces sp. NRRL F-5135 TaxID=1463858 RepID=UPI0004C84B6B|nr:enoyl-ACP reductase FabI [Streptomyces sp. NRRL F-5135]
MMGLLTGKTLLITGVITESSIAFQVARAAQEQGARVVLTGFGRVSLVERIAKRLPEPAPVTELDVTDEEQLSTLPDRVREHTDRLDGVLHSVAYAPPGALDGKFLDTTWEEAATALHVSTYSLQALTTSLLPLMDRGGSVVGLDFDASHTWSGYDWMGVAKAGLESCARYLASHLGARGIRVNLVAAGPLSTLAARNISAGDGSGTFDGGWSERAPLGWDSRNFQPVANACVALFSDLFPATTGEIVHVDGGAHAVGDRPAHTPAVR